MIHVGIVRTNKLVVRITTHFHSGGMNTYISIKNKTKEAYNDNCGGTGGRSEWAQLPQLSNIYLIILNDP